MGGLRREDEQKLRALTEICRSVGRRNLPEDDQLFMLYLEDRYNKFLDEGMRRLRGDACDTIKLKGTGHRLRCASGGEEGPSDQKQDAGAVVPIGKDTATGSHDGDVIESFTASPRNRLPEFPLQEPGKLWTWVLNDLVVGGVPHAAQREHGAGHLLELRRQCVERGVSALSVVSCLETDETVPPGFALLGDWEQFTELGNYYSFPFIPNAKQENPLAVNDEMLEELLSLCSRVYGALHIPVVPKKAERHRGGFSPRVLLWGRKRRSSETIRKKRAAYIMCKTGQTRAWVLAMAYLVSQYGMEYTEADQYLRQLRAFDPSPAQVEWALKFSVFITSPRRAEKSPEEHLYLKLLPQVLSLTPYYRERLLRDLKELT